MLMLHANFVLDTSITMSRRILRGDQWLKPHREHFYQKLVQSGVPHFRVTVLEMALQLVVLGLMLTYLASGPKVRFALLGAVVALWLAFFAWIERRFRRSRSIGAASRLANETTP
jgi:UDP-GlcNAc:undecaprenyl-phosphate GlcNAc-1-phosphate transferase